ncbi:MAG: PfkB family carbohydrate kinase [Chloroflexota bacterium]
MKIAAIGDNCIDVYTNLRQGFPGGGALNFAVHARRAGAQTAYVGVIGDDAYGDWMADTLNAEGVETKYLQRVPGPTALAFVRLVNAERTFIGSDRGVREQLGVTPEIDAYLGKFDWIHTTLDGRVDANIPAWHRAGRKISYDFSHRAKPEQIALLPHVTVAFFSGQRTEPAGARERVIAYQRQGARVVVMTFGENGSVAFDGARAYRQPALPAQVVDTLGAGDAFQAGFIIEYLKSGAVDAALFAGAARAAEVCGHYGAFGYTHAIDMTDPRIVHLTADRGQPTADPSTARQKSSLRSG